MTQALQSTPATHDRAKMARGFGLLMMGRLSMIILSFISNAIMARLLEPSDFGLMAGAMVVVALTDAVFDGAFGLGLVQRRTLDDRYVSATLWLSIALAVALAITIQVSAPLVERFFGFPGLAPLLAVSSAIIVFKAAGNVSRAVLTREQRFRAAVTASLLSYLLGYGLVGISCAMAGLGAWSLAFAALAANLVESAINVFTAKVSVRYAPTRSLTHEIFRTSGLFTVSQSLLWAANSGANAVIGHGLNSTALGFYTRSWKLIEMVTSATAQPLQRVLFPTFSRMQDDLAAARVAFREALSIALPVFMAGSAFCILHSKAIILIALGAKWTDSVLIAQLLFIALTPRCAYKISDSLAFAFGRSGAATARTALQAILVIGGALIGLPHGLIGVASMIAVALWIFYATSVTYAAKLVSMPLTSVLAVHIRACLLVAPAVGIDLIFSTVVGFSFWTNTFISALLGVLALGGTFFFLPSRYAGPEIKAIRSLIVSKFAKGASF